MAPTTRQTTAARKRTTSKPMEGLDFEPIRIPANDEIPDERVPLFYIGDDEYTIPKHIPKGVALSYLRRASEVGHDLATAPLLIRVLGEDAYTALEESKALDEEQLERIVGIIIDLALGKQETKGGKASRRG